MRQVVNYFRERRARRRVAEATALMAAESAKNQWKFGGNTEFSVPTLAAAMTAREREELASSEVDTLRGVTMTMQTQSCPGFKLHKHQFTRSSSSGKHKSPFARVSSSSSCLLQPSPSQNLLDPQPASGPAQTWPSVTVLPMSAMVIASAAASSGPTVHVRVMSTQIHEDIGMPDLDTSDHHSAAVAAAARAVQFAPVEFHGTMWHRSLMISPICSSSGQGPWTAASPAPTGAHAPPARPNSGSANHVSAPAASASASHLMPIPSFISPREAANTAGDINSWPEITPSLGFPASNSSRYSPSSNSSQPFSDCCWTAEIEPPPPPVVHHRLAASFDRQLSCTPPPPVGNWRLAVSFHRQASCPLPPSVDNGHHIIIAQQQQQHSHSPAVNQGRYGHFMNRDDLSPPAVVMCHSPVALFNRRHSSASGPISSPSPFLMTSEFFLGL